MSNIIPKYIKTPSTTSNLVSCDELVYPGSSTFFADLESCKEKTQFQSASPDFTKFDKTIVVPLYRSRNLHCNKLYSFNESFISFSNLPFFYSEFTCKKQISTLSDFMPIFLAPYIQDSYTVTLLLGKDTYFDSWNNGYLRYEGVQKRLELGVSETTYVSTTPTYSYVQGPLYCRNVRLNPTYPNIIRTSIVNTLDLTPIYNLTNDITVIQVCFSEVKMNDGTNGGIPFVKFSAQSSFPFDNTAYGVVFSSIASGDASRYFSTPELTTIALTSKVILDGTMSLYKYRYYPNEVWVVSWEISLRDTNTTPTKTRVCWGTASLEMASNKSMSYIKIGQGSTTIDQGFWRALVW